MTHDRQRSAGWLVKANQDNPSYPEIERTQQAPLFPRKGRSSKASDLRQYSVFWQESQLLARWQGGKVDDRETGKATTSKSAARSRAFTIHHRFFAL
jgi:hypothetical protein